MWWFVIGAQLTATVQPDSLEVLRSARLAQAHFEDTRIAHLPWSRGESGAQRCDEVVGRFCFWHDEDDSWTPISDPPATTEGRSQLLRTLDRLHALGPRDPWITGQRVRYLIEAARLDEALAAARECTSSPWWCEALLGYALHASRDYVAADAAFAAALAASPEDQRCRWTDLRLILGGLRGRYGKLSCAQRVPLDRRIWWLADPLYLVPGNERRTEHFSRRVMTALQDGARSGYVIRWGSDLEELVLRYGWPVGFERVIPEMSAPQPRTIAHNEREGREFVPPARFVEAPNTIRPEEWDLDPDRPVTSYAPAYASVFHELAHQIALFRRGDSMVVVAGYDVRASTDTARAVTRVEAALVLVRNENAEPVVVRGTGRGPEGVLTAIARADSTLISLETLDTADSVHAGRIRYWLPVAPRGQGVTLSDPLILRVDREDSLPESLADAISLVRPTTRARRGERVAVFWETYGLEGSTQPFRVTLTVTRRATSRVRKAAEWMGLVARDTRYVSLSWEEPARAGTTVYPRALAISLPDAAAGTYLLDVAVAVPGAAIARAEREIVLERD